MHRWTARAAGGISQRLKPGRATIRSRARKLGTATDDLRRDGGRRTPWGTTGSRPTSSQSIARYDARRGDARWTTRSIPPRDPTYARPMAHEVKGVVAASKGAPVRIETIVVPDPGPGEAVVDVQACGVCHTDLHYREGGINDDFPFLRGHEAAGRVAAVGEGVTNVAVGDYVILNWRAVCGQCRACLAGKPWYCFSTHNATQKMTLEDGTVLSPALGIGAFVEKTLVHAGQCTKVDRAAPPTAAGLLGCGIMAGAGAAINTAAVQRGETVAVFGCGGVGDAAIAGAKLAGATMIIAVDLDDRKLEWAKKLGATHTVNSRDTDAVEAIKALTCGFGVDVAIDAVGHPK